MPLNLRAREYRLEFVKLDLDVRGLGCEVFIPLLSVTLFRAADTLPTQLADETFCRRRSGFQARGRVRIIPEGQGSRTGRPRLFRLSSRSRGKAMSEQITIQVSDQVVQHAAQVAAQTHQPIEEVLSHWLDSIVTELPVERLSDAEVLALTKLDFTPEQQGDFSHLLEQNREGTIETEGQTRLDQLMSIYEGGWLRKSQALREAVRRGLREPLEP